MGWGIDHEKLRSQWGEWTRFLEVARGDKPAGLENMFGRVFRTAAQQQASGNSPGDDLLGPLPPGNSSGDEPFSLDPVPTPEKQYALTMLAHLVEMGVLTRREFDVLQARVRGN